MDIGTGSGCIPLALKFNRAHWQIDAVDISDKALLTAQKNAEACGLDIHFQQCDILTSVPDGGPWDIIISNPPYIPYKEQQIMSRNVVDFEPATALFVPNNDPLLFYRQITEAAKKLNPKVEIYIDGGIRRGTDVAKCLAFGASLVFLSRPVAWGLRTASTWRSSP
jgi:release factor glutamine methyltransferase